MEKHFKAISIIEELIKEGYNNKKLGDLVNLFMTDKRVDMDVILLLYSRYYIKQKFKKAINQEAVGSTTIITFIERNYQDSNKLMAAFYKEQWLVSQLLDSYIKMGNIVGNDLYMICYLGKEKIVETLDKDYNIVSVDYINNIVNEEIKKKIKIYNKPEEKSQLLIEIIMNAPLHWISIILSNAYIIGKYLQKDVNYAVVIEETDFTVLSSLFRTHTPFYARTVSYMSVIYSLSASEYIELFDMMENDDIACQTIKKINPFYIFDKMNVENKRKQLRQQP